MVDPALPPLAANRERFAHGREYTLGIEEELMLLDADTLELAQAIEPLLREAGDAGRLKPELMQCQVEIASSPCRTPAAALEKLAVLRGEVVRSAASCGIRVAAAGTHPFSALEEQRVTVRDRYRELVAALRYPAHQVVVFGMHVHVAVGGAAKALQVIEGVLPHLPLLLALSASSPFLAGEETGLASTRVVLGQTMPRTGLPPLFESYEEYLATLEQLRRAGAMADSSYAWWDARLNPRFGTIEVRIMDSQPRVEDSAAIAGLVQALVRHYGKAYDRGIGIRRANRLIVAENRWLTIRHGLRAPLIREGGGDAGARVLAGELLDRVAEDAAAADGDWVLRRIEGLLERGSSAERQVRSFRKGASLREILTELADETAAV